MIEIQEFLNEATHRGGRTRTSALYDAFRKWLDDRGDYYRLGDTDMTRNKFTRELRAHGYPARKSNGVMVCDLGLIVGGIEFDDAESMQTYLDGAPMATIKPQFYGDYKPTRQAIGYGDEYPWGMDAGKKLDMIVALFSKHGANMSKREVAEHFGTTEDDVRDTLKSANVRKTDPPMSPERIESEDTDDLVAESLERKRHSLKVALARAERKALVDRAEKAESLVRDHDTQRRHILNGIAAGLADVKPIEIGDPSMYDPEGWAAHVPIADPHVGLQVYGKESWTNENYHTDLAAERIVDAAVRAGDWIDGMSGVIGGPRVIHYSILGDLFHALHYATVSGRPMQVDGRQRRVFEKVVNAVATAIATMAQVAPVEARLTDGNHDGDLVFYAATTLAAYFRDVPNVTVETSYNHQCSFFEGETLHVLDHGRTWTNLDTPKVGRDASVILEELGTMYPPHRNAKIWVGDKHSPSAAWPTRKTEVIRVPALASLDDYAQGINYSHDFDAYVYALTDRGTIAHQGRLYE